MAREKREAWAGRVERWQRSGLTASRFASREGVNAGTLAFWKWKLRQDGRGGGRRSERRVEQEHGGGERVAFVELVSSTSAPASVPGLGPDARSGVFEVVLPAGYRVRVVPGFERGSLGELLDVLEARR